MKNKAFTLIELLAVIVVLGIIMLIAVTSVSNVINNSRQKAYLNNVDILENASRNYLMANDSKVPVNIDEISIITLTEMQSSGFMSIVKDVANSSTECTGYVTVKKISASQFSYSPYLKCGSNYETSGYASQDLASVEVLVVAGGGSGGTSQIGMGGSGGGGAGGLIYNASYAVTAGTNYNVAVGRGGNARTNTMQTGENGANSVFASLTAIGGGAGGCGDNCTGNIGGSGGGAGYNGYNYLEGALGTINQGYKGGNVLYNNNGAGGGGAGGVGGNTSSTGGVAGGDAGAGGIGFTLTISGSSITYAHGGGGGGSSQTCGQSGTANSGDGGNGIYAINCPSSGAGGSGIVIIRYSGVQKANGGTVTSVGGYTIHTFTNIGTSTFQVLDF